MTVAVDLGGTWTRVRIDGRDTRVRTPSHLRHPDVDPTRLFAAQVDVLGRLVPAGRRVALSFGAALDETTGVAWGSGPLWGPGLPAPLLVRDALTTARPDVTWYLVNDVTAGLVDFVGRYARPSDRRVTYLTVSSGIALRTADLTTRTVTVDGRGLQGEVGHLTAVTSAPPEIAAARCPCGGVGHLAAVSAGPAIDHVAAVLGVDRSVTEDLARHAAAGHTGARAVVSTIVEPIAELLRTMATLDPALDLVGIGGGVASGLREVYEETLHSMLDERRSYADGRRLDVRVCGPNEIDTLAGAVDMMEGALRVVK